MICRGGILSENTPGNRDNQEDFLRTLFWRVSRDKFAMNDYQRQKQMPAENNPAISKCIFPLPWRQASQFPQKGSSMQLFCQINLLLLDRTAFWCRHSQRHHVTFQTGSGVSKQYFLDLHSISIKADVFRGVFEVEVLTVWCYEPGDLSENIFHTWVKQRMVVPRGRIISGDKEPDQELENSERLETSIETLER